ncbi:hypothetical protein HDU93_007898 [Gonapodya sp. JEL0774]|nr:hypothetical protein HDU93_007898 [Gonapodya sp. JEL0774]
MPILEIIKPKIKDLVPGTSHASSSTLPEVTLDDGSCVKLLIGPTRTATSMVMGVFDKGSPVDAKDPDAVYAAAWLTPLPQTSHRIVGSIGNGGSGLVLKPHDAQERAVYAVDEGGLIVRSATGKETRLPQFHLGVFPEGEEVRVIAPEGVSGRKARAVVLGGNKLDGHRNIWWNYVASDPAAIASAREHWAALTDPSSSPERVPAGEAPRFGLVPGEVGVDDYIRQPEWRRK